MDGERGQHLRRVLSEDAFAAARRSKVFVCGAGGIGCELLKTLVLSGFEDLEVIDLDTIDASNLNRQFLFRNHHVGKAKSEIARESALKFNPSARIKAHLGNVKDPKFDREFYQQFSIVLNGLDNRSARQHVNRMCMKAAVPLIESGTMGYNGQVQPIVKDVTACYDCELRRAEKVSFAVCTIHQRPSSMVHCVHYAKEFYKRFFGEEVDKDPEMQYLDEVRAAGKAEGKGMHWVPRIFDAMFDQKVRELLSMSTGWPSGKTPKPVSFEEAERMVGEDAPDADGARIAAKRVKSVSECATNFVDSFTALCRREEAEGKVGFDKDDDLSMALVGAVANLRAWIFHIPLQSDFDVKTIAGNIVPAIATSNAVAAGLIVLEAMKVLQGHHDKLRCQYLVRNPSSTGRKRTGRWDVYVAQAPPLKPNLRCYVCQSGRNQFGLELNVSATTVRFVVNHICGHELSMEHPMVSLCRGDTEKLVYEDQEHEGFAGRPLSQWIDISDPQGWSLKVEDMVQELEAELVLKHNASLDPADYTVLGDTASLAKAAPRPAAPAGAEEDDGGSDEVVAYHPRRHGSASAGGSHAAAVHIESVDCDDDDVPPAKRQRSDE
eukprot:TRINITY_DN8231_c0_g1_i2.p1 TRINITY_DN8231_c0_g1~~TRINITY_DN8231_c0_g1_i2.p1  ORF type:complete len:606 (+),score=200.40 TRINITY_DN8231_c0_g1_i2:71-1888(+)